jgi:hypothetical protein
MAPLYTPLDPSKKQIRLLRLSPQDVPTITSHKVVQAPVFNANTERATPMVSLEANSLHPLLAALIAKDDQSMEDILDLEKRGCAKFTITNFH